MKKVIISLAASILSFLCMFLLFKVSGLFVFIAPVFAVIAVISGIIGAVTLKNAPGKIVLVISLIALLCSAALFLFMYVLGSI